MDQGLLGEGFRPSASGGYLRPLASGSSPLPFDLGAPFCASLAREGARASSPGPFFVGYAVRLAQVGLVPYRNFYGVITRAHPLTTSRLEST